MEFGCNFLHNSIGTSFIPDSTVLNVLYGQILMENYSLILLDFFLNSIYIDVNLNNTSPLKIQIRLTMMRMIFSKWFFICLRAVIDTLEWINQLNQKQRPGKKLSNNSMYRFRFKKEANYSGIKK